MMRKRTVTALLSLATVSSALAVEPLTYANVIAYFKAAHLRATEVQKRCTIFFEGEWTNPNVYNYGLIIVENSDEDLQVTFYLTDAHEMNWVTEFLDAPFFAPKETEKALRPRGFRARSVRPKNWPLPRGLPSLAAAPRGNHCI